MKVNIIGCGIIGGILLEDMSKAKKDEIFGTEVNSETLNRLSKKGYIVKDNIWDGCDVYIISVLTTDQVKEVIQKIDYDNDPLVVIESTIAPGTCDEILKEYPDINLVIFPHRFYDKDPTKRVFNLHRVMGAVNKKVMDKALKFYTRYMNKRLIHPTDIKTAEICKPIENTLRYVSIAFAEELKTKLTELGYDFDKVRSACNTKWNCDIMEARDGIGLHCLPKDIKLIDGFFGPNFMIKAAMNADIEYREMMKQWNKKKA